METHSVSRRYETRRSAKAKELIAKSRVDWSRTKRGRLIDSEEEEDETTSASEKEIRTSSEDDAEEEDEPVVNGSKQETPGGGSSLPVVEASCDGSAAEDAEEESVVPGKRKRSRSSVMYDSNSDASDESCIVRKVFAKRKCVIDEEDLSTDEERQTSPAEKEIKRKQARLVKLQELSQQRSSRVRSDPREDSQDGAIILEDTDQPPVSPAEISDSVDDDSMKDFIVEEEEEEEDKELEEEKSENGESQPQEKKHAMSSKTLLEHYVPSLCHVDPYIHFQRVVRAFLINAVDDTFLISLYAQERNKKYAQEMLTSLRYLDDRFIRPRLENLLSRSRWKERYKERVDNYPKVCIVFGNSVKRSCQACELQRHCKLTVVLSGQQYNSDTMETDDFMLHDKQRLKVGSVCGNRTQVYHNLKHFKYKLYQDCHSVMKQEGSREEPLKETVDRVFSQLLDDGWIQKHYSDLEDCMSDADFFQEEKMD